ncbi:MAG: DUF1131 family protein [Cocleimonas sp.]
MSKWHTLLSFVFAMGIAAGLTACSNDDEKKEVTTEKENTIILSADGIGSINASSSFNMHQITLAFSKYNVVEELNYHTGTPYPVIRVADGVKTIMTVIPDAAQQNIYSVIVEDNTITNSLGHHLGTPYKTVYAERAEQCQAGAEDMLGKALCYAPKTPNVIYIFNGKSGSSVEGKLPTDEDLQDWILESIIWRPKSK